MRILFAIDLSEPGSVTDSVASLSARLGAELYVLHVFIPTASGPMPMFAWIPLAPPARADSP